MGKMTGAARLRAMGGVIDLAPVNHAITWTNDAGEEHTFNVWVRRVSFWDAGEVWQHKGPEQRALMLTKIILLDDGKGGMEPLDLADARAIHPTLGMEFVKRFNELNGGEPKNSQPRTSSGVNSSSAELADEPSRKRNTDSPQTKSESGPHTESSAEP